MANRSQQTITYNIERDSMIVAMPPGSRFPYFELAEPGIVDAVHRHLRWEGEERSREYHRGRSVERDRARRAAEVSRLVWWLRELVLS